MIYKSSSRAHSSNQLIRSVRICIIILIFIENYLQLVNILEDAALVIKKEKQEESKRSEASG